MKIQLRPIHDQVIVLVGATSGIGLDTAKHLAERGARVVIVGRSQEGLDDALKQVRSHAENYRMVNSGGYSRWDSTSAMGDFGSMDTPDYPAPGRFTGIESEGSAPIHDTSMGGPPMSGRAPIREASTSLSND